MACSPAQLAANLRNSKLSTGPRTAEGRLKVSQNALKHGLTGSGVAVPDEDVPVIQERFDAFNAALNPNQAVSEFLIRHLALMSVRMERCARQETANITKNMIRADQVESDTQREELQKRVDWIAAEPGLACVELERLPRGIAWMVSSWEDLKAHLFGPGLDAWSFDALQRAMNLTGFKIDHFPKTRIEVLSDAIRGRFDSLQPGDWPDLEPMARRLAARDELGRIIDAEITRLNEKLARINQEALAKVEAGAKARALFDASKEAVLARKYEAAAERGFYKALKTIIELNELTYSHSSMDHLDVNPEMEISSGESALNFPEPETAVHAPKRRPPAPADRRKSKGRRGHRGSEMASESHRE